MTPSSAALLLAAIALVIAAYVVACDRIGGGPHDGPWSLGAVLLAGLSLAPTIPAMAMTTEAGAGLKPLSAGARGRLTTLTLGMDFPGALPGGTPRALLSYRGESLHRAMTSAAPEEPGESKGNAAQRAHAPATAGPAGVPGGFGSRGAALCADGRLLSETAAPAMRPKSATALLDAGPVSGESLQGRLASAAGRHLGCGASVQERGVRLEWVG